MPSSELEAISSIDGRYGHLVEELKPFFSEKALMRYRLRIETEYFIALVSFLKASGHEILNDVSIHVDLLRSLYSESSFNIEEAKKIKELEKAILGDNSSIVSAKIDLPELQGNARDIVREKCLSAARIVNGPVIVEDTSLCFNAINGLPGPYIKWFLDKIGLSGLTQMLSGFSDHSAYAMCIYAFTPSADEEPVLFEGRTNGTVVPARPHKDDKSFGWDPIFQPCDEDQPKGIRAPLTYAEMDKSVKNMISHRSRSLNKLKAYLRENGILE